MAGLERSSNRKANKKAVGIRKDICFNSLLRQVTGPKVYSLKANDTVYCINKVYCSSQWVALWQHFEIEVAWEAWEVYIWCTEGRTKLSCIVKSSMDMCVVRYFILLYLQLTVFSHRAYWFSAQKEGRRWYCQTCASDDCHY